MPLAHVHVLQGHPRPVLQALLRELSSAYAQVLEAPMERLQVWITEEDPGLYAVGGVPADEVMATTPRAEVEIPLAQLVMFAGRPDSQVAAAIRVVSEVIARHLGGNPDRVRIEVRRVDADHWGIGGVPASIKRKAELDARRQTA